MLPFLQLESFPAPNLVSRCSREAKSAVMAVDRAVDAKPQSVEAITCFGCPAARM